MAPGGDFFKPIRDRKATMVTGHIDRFTETGILMKDGQHVDADFIIDCSGKPTDHTELELAEYIPVNTALVKRCYWDYPQYTHTRTLTSPCNALTHAHTITPTEASLLRLTV